MEYINKVKHWEVIDADTIRLELDLGYHLSFEINARLIGIDAPETRLLAERQTGRKVSEVALKWLLEAEGVEYNPADRLDDSPGKPSQSTALLFDLDDSALSGLVFKSSTGSRDKFGRGLGDLFNPENPERTLAGYLLRAGLVVPYSGGTKRVWTKEKLDTISVKCESILNGTPPHVYPEKSASDLMVDLARLGIQLEAHGDRLRYSPRSAVTPDLADRMKAHKAELLAILRPEIEAPNDQRFDDWPEHTLARILHAIKWNTK